MSKYKLIGLGVFVSLAVAFVVAGSSVQALGDIFKVSRDASLKDVLLELRDVSEILQPQEVSLGAVSSPDLQSNYIGVGGLREHRFSAGPTLAASSTVCSFNPDFGTTTVKSVAFQLNTGTSSATVLTVGKATNNNTATTTSLVSVSFGAGAQGTMYAATSSADAVGLNGTWTLGPNDYLNFGMQGVDLGSSLNGSCSAILLVH